MTTPDKPSTPAGSPITVPDNESPVVAAPDVLLVAALRRLNLAVAGLGRIKDGKTLFELRPSQDEDSLMAWLELNAAQKIAFEVLAAAQSGKGGE